MFGRSPALAFNPTYQQFVREPGLTYSVYPDADIAEAFTRPFATQLPPRVVNAPHYEVKFARMATYGDYVDGTSALLWMRRPTRYRERLPAWDVADNDDIVLVHNNEGVLRFRVERAVDFGATGYLVGTVIDVNPAAIDVRGDMLRQLQRT